jgi:two-component system sensor histidine kinase RegB
VAAADAAPALADRARRPERLALRRNLLQLIELRWLAVAGQLATILFVRYGLGVPLPLTEMLTLLGVLVLFNGISVARTRWGRPVSNVELFGALLVDVVVLTAQLYFSGGIANPFIFLYLLQVAVASVLLRPDYIWAIVVVTGLGFVTLTQWHRPIALPSFGEPELSAQYIGGLLVCFILNATLLVIFIGRIERNLRQRDASLAQLRQRAAEEEHIVRMGLLASGAAHELGTPLATLSVILGDWARMAPFAGEPELREEIEEMQRQIERCKAIVSGILMSAGETRADAPVQTSLHAFLDGLAADWRRTRGSELEVDRDGVPDLPIISDTALAQMVGNVLDNALEAAPGAPIRLQALADADTLTLVVRDQGPGFAPTVLARLGTPYVSTKAKPGRGLGLFLAVNVARTLGGSLSAHNVPQGGAQVRIVLPLASLTPESPADDRT